MDAQASARLLGFGRLAIGAAMLVAPQKAVGAWIGADADRTGTQVVTRAFGAREILLGFIAAHVASRPGVGRRTIQALAFCDAVDAVVTVGARQALPASGVAMVGLMATGGAVSHTVLAQRLPA